MVDPRSARSVLLAAAILLGGARIAVADVRLPKVISDHMVLQAGPAARVWGKADAGEAVTVTLSGVSAQAVAGPDGRWQVSLPGLTPTPAGASGAEMVIQGKNRLVVTDVMVGEVWLCSGQSNMDFRISRTQERPWCGLPNDAEVIAAADRPRLRMFVAAQATKDEPQDDVAGEWWVSSPATAAQFSAVAYFFGRDLQDARGGVPVGLVVSSYGASTAQAWVSPKALSAVPSLAKMVTDYRAAVAAWNPDEAATKYAAAVKTWEEAAAKAKADGKPAPGKPREPRDPRLDQHSPSVLYHGMLAPIAPYTVRGVLWYQGESNGYNNALYADLMTTLIAEWRQLIGNPDLPFYQVQLAAYRAPATQPVQDNSQLARVREAQRLTSATIPHCGMATAVDIGDEKDVHPRNKQEVGRRLALLARANVYGEPVESSGPTVTATAVEGNQLRITFAHATGGLVLKPAPTTSINPFALREGTGPWVPAFATVDGASLLLSAPGITHPTAARYAWADNPPLALYNTAGLPASPFKTDE